MFLNLTKDLEVSDETNETNKKTKEEIKKLCTNH